MSSSKNVELLLENKKEYIAHLNDILIPYYTKELLNLYESVAKNDSVLKDYQNVLAKIPEYNHLQIKELYKHIIEANSYDYFPELLKALITTIVNINMIMYEKENMKIKVRIPTPENFIHTCFVAIARNLWKKPYLLYHKVRTIERQYNINQLEKIIQNSILYSIRTLVPLDKIVQSMNNVETVLEETQRIEEPVVEEEVKQKSRVLEQEVTKEESVEEVKKEESVEEDADESEAEGEEEEDIDESEEEEEDADESDAEEEEEEDEAEEEEEETESEEETETDGDEESEDADESESEIEKIEEPQKEDVRVVEINDAKLDYYEEIEIGNEEDEIEQDRLADELALKLYRTKNPEKKKKKDRVSGAFF